MLNIKINQLSKSKRNRKIDNQIKRGLINQRPSKGSGRLGYNSYKYNVLNNSDGVVNTLDLGNIIDYSETEGVIDSVIKKTIKSKNFPLRVITHSVIDKVISFKNVMRNYDNLKEICLDPNNPFTFTIVPK